MPTPLATAFVRIRPDPKMFGPELKGALEGESAMAGRAGAKVGESFAAGLRSKVSRVARDISVGTVGATVAVGVASAKMAVDFQQAMEKVHTQAGASQADVRQLSAEVLKLGTHTQQGPQELAAALYHLKSVGLDNVGAMKALRVASDLAAVGGANLEEVTNAIGGAWRSGIKGAQDFGAAASTVNAIIGAGNMRMEDFVAAIGTGILPAAKTFGLSLRQVGAALALMTDEGIPATDAATRLRMSFSLLAAPSDHARGILSDIGIKGTMLADAMRSPGGLIAAIAMLKDHLEKFGGTASQQANILSRAFGGGRSSSAIMTLLNNLEVLRQKQQQVNETTGRFAGAVVAQRKTAGAQFALLRSQVEVLGVRLGDVLLPKLTDVARWMANNTPTVMRLGLAIAGTAAAVTGLYVAVKTLTIIGGVVTFFTRGAAALRSFASASVAAATVQKALNLASAASAGGIGRVARAQMTLRAAMEGSAAATTSFAVGAEGATVAVGGLTGAESAAAVAGAALAAINPVVWAVGAVIAVGALTAVLIHFGGSITDVTDKLAQQDHATGFNIEGYRKLAQQTTANQYSQTRLGHAIRDSVPAFESVRVGAAAYSTTLGAVNRVHEQAATTSDRLVGQLSVLQGQFGLTRSEAIELASRAHVTAQSLADTGDSGQAAMAKIHAYGTANGGAAVRSILLADASSRVSSALNTVSSRLLSGQSSLLGYQQSLADATSALKASTTGLHGNTNAAIAARTAVLNSTEAAIKLADAESHQAGGMDKATGIIRQQISWLQTHASHSRFARQEVDALRQALAKIKSEHADITVKASGTWKVIQAGGVLGGAPVAGGGPHAARGLYINTGRPGVDDQLILAQRDELIVPPGIVKSGAVDHLRGMIPGFATGGVVGALQHGQPAGVGQFMIRQDRATLRAVEAATAKATAAALSATLSGFGGPLPGGDLSAHGGNAAANQAIARQLLPLFGFSQSQMGPLIALWNQESGWNQFAMNAGSGAYGIPQSLPASKMAAAGADYLTNPVTQERWGLGYIRSRYGTPAGAWAHEVAHNWYDKGGPLRPGLTLAYNGTGRTETVLGPGAEERLGQIAQLLETLPGRLVDSFNGISRRAAGSGYYSAAG